MKADQLMEAIEHIDDRYIEESAYGVRRKSNIPWGMILTAACFCLAIGVTIFLHNAGLLPHSGIPTESTVPTTTDFTMPYPTVALPEPEKFFGEPGSLHNTALGEMFESAEDVQFFYLLGKGDIGKGVDLTEQEKKLLDDKLKYGTDYADVWRLTKEQIDNAFWSVYGLTWEQVIANFDPDNYNDLGINYSIYLPVYLEETGYYYGYGGRETGVDIAGIIVEYLDDGLIKMHYSNQWNTARFVAMLQTHETGYHILSNTFSYSESTDPTDPVETTAPTIPPQARPSVEEFFSDRKNLQNYVISAQFSDPTQLDLRPYYIGKIDGESTYATDLEHEKLSTVMQGYDRNKLFRATKAQLDGIMLTLFNITTDQLTTDWEQNFTYLAETGCYYGRVNDDRGYAVYIDRKAECDDGTILMYYALFRGDEPNRVARLQPHETGYYILSNERYVDNTGKSEDQVAMEELFILQSWYNQALTCEYDSPEQIGILSFFYCGIPGESKITDEEKAQLKNMQGFGTPAGDICRLHPDKMNAVLTECFGITLEDVDPTGFNSLAYLESTNCYYFKASSPNFVENFKADRVERNSDGTIDVYYNISYKGDYIVTVKPYGDGYRVLSNRCINSKPSIPQTPKEPTGDTELEMLFAGYAKVSQKEATKKMVDAFLSDPDTFVRLLAKQEWYRGILGVLSRNVTDNHPQIGAYRAAISSLLTKELPEKERNIVYGMAVYSGLSNYIPNTPAAVDYRMLLDIMDNYSFEGETAELLRKFCIEDAAGVIAVIVQDKESQTIYIERITALTSEEELKQLKQSMTQLISELKNSTDTGVQEQIKCAEMIIESCDEEIG